MSNKDSRKQFHFNVWDENLKSFLGRQDKFGEWIRTIIDDVRTGKLSYDTQEIDIDTEIKKLRAAVLKLNVLDKLKDAGYSLDQLELFVNSGSLPAPPHENRILVELPSPSSSITTTPEKPTFQGSRYGVTKNNTPKTILQSDGSLRCMSCNRKFGKREHDFQQIDDYRIHFEGVHRPLTDRERDELMGLYSQ